MTRIERIMPGESDLKPEISPSDMVGGPRRGSLFDQLKKKAGLGGNTPDTTSAADSTAPADKAQSPKSIGDLPPGQRQVLEVRDPINKLTPQRFPEQEQTPPPASAGSGGGSQQPPSLGGLRRPRKFTPSSESGRAQTGRLQDTSNRQQRDQSQRPEETQLSIEDIQELNRLRALASTPEEYNMLAEEYFAQKSQPQPQEKDLLIDEESLEDQDRSLLATLSPEKRKQITQAYTAAGVQEIEERATPEEFRNFIRGFFGEDVLKQDIGEEVGVDRQVEQRDTVTSQDDTVRSPIDRQRRRFVSRGREKTSGSKVHVEKGVQKSGIESSNELEESSIHGLSTQDIALFEKNGITAEDLHAMIDEVGYENFLSQARYKLAGLREDAENDLTPEQIAKKEAQEREERIKQLKEDLAILQDMSAATDDEKKLVELRRSRINEELISLAGETGVGDGGPERPGGTEGPPPPSDGSLEYEAGPERGREIVREIVKWEGRRAAGKLSEVNWKRLNYLYLQHEIHIEAARIVSLRVKPSERKEVQQPPSEIREIDPEAFNGFRSVAEWVADYENGTIADWDRFGREVNIYFQEARAAGLLDDIDRVLTSSYWEIRRGIGRSLTADEILYGTGGSPGVEQRIHGALNAATSIFRKRQRDDQELSRLALIDPQARRLGGIWELYVQMARDRFTDVISRQDLDGTSQVPEGYLDNEFHLDQAEDDNTPKETFWRLQHGWYIEVYAQTEEEFNIAADSYISRLESISPDAKKITQEATQFIDVLAKSEGAKRLLQTNPDFINELILGIEARVGVFGADDSNERYNGADYKAFLDFINKDGKGPDRWLALSRLLDGRVAAALWKLDKDPRWEMLFATYGSRGQLAKMSIAQRDRATDQGVFNQVYKMLIEEMMGVRIKNKDDVGKLTQFMSDKTFTSFFDGLYQYDSKRESKDYGDVNIRAYNDYLKARTPEGQSLTRSLTRTERLGKIQLELREFQKKIASGEKLVIKRKDKQDRNYEPEKDNITNLLNESDERFYKSAYAEAKKAVDIAFQMYGALGEKSKRAGGVFKTAERVDAEGNKFQYFVPIHWAEKWVQFAETMTKMQYAHLSAKERTAKVKQARDLNIALLKRDGFGAMMVDADGRRMKLKRPDAPQGVEVDFYTATHHAYANWSGHTYWSYQEEHRHLLLSPRMFKQAMDIRAGKLLPEEADPVAVQLLILDPTLKRVRRFEKGFEDRERKLVMASVEDSYQSHWRITRELYRAFWPKEGTPAKDINIYYGLQDYGGYRKTLESMRARIAEDPERFARRGRRLLPDLHNPVASYSEYLGQGSMGSLGAIRMMGYPVYRLAGTFALDKFAANAEVGGKLSDALLGTQNNEQVIVEGLLLKLTNDADALLQGFGIDKLPKEWGNPGAQQEFCDALRKSFGRLEKYLKYLTTVESLVRNATGAQWLEDVDILTDNGGLNSKLEKYLSTLPVISYVSSAAGHELTRAELAKIITDADKLAVDTEELDNERFNKGAIDEGSISTNTGSGRHSARLFFDTFIKLILDETTRGGAQMYPGERYIYEHLNDKIIVYDPHNKIGYRVTNETIADWLFNKFIPT